MIQIVSIILKTKKGNIELSMEEARELYNELSPYFKEPVWYPVVYPVFPSYPPINPMEPTITWSGTHTIADENVCGCVMKQ